MQINDTVSIVTACGRNVVHNTMAHAASHGTVVNMTDKAIKLKGQTRNGKIITCWLPRKALRPLGAPDRPSWSNSAIHVVTLAPWFRPEGWAARWIDMTTDLAAVG